MDTLVIFLGGYLIGIIVRPRMDEMIEYYVKKYEKYIK